MVEETRAFILEGLKYLFRRAVYGSLRNYDQGAFLDARKHP